jgi:hypothetical protein
MLLTLTDSSFGQDEIMNETNLWLTASSADPGKPLILQCRLVMQSIGLAYLYLSGEMKE